MRATIPPEQRLTLLSIARVQSARRRPVQSERAAVMLGLRPAEDRAIRVRLLPEYEAASRSLDPASPSPTSGRLPVVSNPLPLLAADLTFIRVNGGRA